MIKNSTNYTMGSLFDGSGGFPLAAYLCGVEPIWASEIEPYPIAVTRSRFPNMKHLGNISNVDGGKIDPVDFITFGFPCQSVSMAGKREGIKHTDLGDGEATQSGLFMEAIRIIKEMRKATNGQFPQFAIFENVPGLFSHDKGETFRTVCEELIKIVEPTAVMPPVPKNGWAYADIYVGGRFSFAYRVFDTQFWPGTPQRRRRIYAVLDLTGERAGGVLFELEGVCRNYPTCGTTWKSVAGNSEDCTGTANREGRSISGESYGERRTRRISINGDIAGTLDASYYKGCGMRQGIERDVVLDIVPYTLKIRSGCEGGGKGALVQKNKSATLATNNDQYLFQPIGVDLYNVATTDNVTKTLNAAACDADHVPCVIEHASNTCVKCYDARGNGDGDVASTLTGDHENRVTDYTNIVCTGPKQTETTNSAFEDDSDVPTSVTYAMQGFGDYKESEIASGLKARDYKDATDLVCQTENHNSCGMGLDDVSDVQVQYAVRRLTPTECGRFQGFPDFYSMIDPKDDFTEEEYQFWLNVRNTHAEINGKPTKNYTKAQMLKWYNKLHTNSAEYRMWGNGVALPPTTYCIKGIVDQLNKKG